MTEKYRPGHLLTCMSNIGNHACDCPAGRDKLITAHVTPKIDENCRHEWSTHENGETDAYGHCTKCGLSFQRYIHSLDF